MVVWRVLVGAYVAATVVALVIVNADQSDWAVGAGIMVAAALALGWGTASGWGVVVALLLVPVALPFGETNQFAGGGETDSVALLAVVAAAMSAMLILAAAGARILYNRVRLRRLFRQAAAIRTLPPLRPAQRRRPGPRGSGPDQYPDCGCRLRLARLRLTVDEVVHHGDVVVRALVRAEPAVGQRVPMARQRS